MPAFALQAARALVVSPDPLVYHENTVHPWIREARMRLHNLRCLLLGVLPFLSAVGGCQQATVEPVDFSTNSPAGDGGQQASSVLEANHKSDRVERETRTVQHDSGGVTLRYTLPVRPHPPASTAAQWERGAPVVQGNAQPMRIVYDQAYMEAYLRWAVDAPTECGAASYRIQSDAAAREFTSGLDMAYLGRQFREQDLVAFLKERVEGARQTRTFRMESPPAQRAAEQAWHATAERRLQISPWQRDTVSVIYLLDQAESKAAYRWVKRLVRDPSPEVRTAAVMALGGIGRSVPEALADVRALFTDEALAGAAFDAMRRAGRDAVPILTAAFDHPAAAVRNRAVYTLPWLPFEDAASAVVVALQHEDAEVRQWAVAVVLDIQSRGVVIEHAKVSTALRRLAEDTDELAATRESAEIALSNLTVSGAPDPAD